MKNLFKAILLTALSLNVISCEKCKDCYVEERTSFVNISSFSGIPQSEFNDINAFKTYSKYDTIGETCGDNLDKYDGGYTKTDTLPVTSYQDNNGNTIMVSGGIFEVYSQLYTCK